MVVIPDAAVLANLNSISHGYRTLCSDKRIVRHSNIVTYDDTSLAAHTQDDPGAQADAISYTKHRVVCRNYLHASTN
jgi:hypothetical protein